MLLGRPPIYEWLDVPLVTDDGLPFGKITLDKKLGRGHITSADYHLVVLLLRAISDAISACGWFTGYHLPIALVDHFRHGYDESRGLHEIVRFSVDHVQRTFNASHCSLFWVHRPSIPSGVTCRQIEKLVLWGTTFHELRSQENSGYYRKGQGLTGRVWQTAQPLYEANLTTNKRWLRRKGHLNDSRTHQSYIGVPLLGQGGRVRGVLRVPEGKDHRLLKVESEILSQFCTSVLSPAIDAFLRVDRLDKLLSLTNRFQRHLSTVELASEHPNASIWKYAVDACIATFGEATKKVIAYSVSKDQYKIEDKAGRLDFNRGYSDHSTFVHKGRAAATRVLDTGKPILLTDIPSAEKAGAYIPVVRDVASAMVVPLRIRGRPFGMLAVTSSLYDLLPERDLELLQLIARHCETLRELENILKAAQDAERKRMLHVAAYGIKVPARRFRTYANKLISQIGRGSTPTSTDVSKMIHTSRWLLTVADGIQYSVEHLRPHLVRRWQSANSIAEAVGAVLRDWLMFDNPKRLRLRITQRSWNGATKCLVDRENLFTAILCIFDNAMKAAPSDSTISVTFSLNRELLSIGIRDDGRGISPEHLHEICEPGFRTHYEVGRGIPRGTGFGLTVARAIVRGHKGEIVFVKEKGAYRLVRTLFPLTVR